VLNSQFLRILHISTFFPPYSFGGDAVFVRRLCDNLHREGHEVEVIQCVDAFRLFEHGGVRETLFPYPVHRIHSGTFVSPLYSYVTGRPGFWKARELQRVLDKFRPDLLHFHSPSLMGAPEVLTWGNAPRIYTLHDHWLVCPTHVLFQNRQRPCEEPLTCNQCLVAHRRPPQPWRWTSAWKEKLRGIDRFLAPSEFTRERHLRARLPMKIDVMPLFVPDPPAALPPVAARSYFLMAGRFEELKGFLGVAKLWPRDGAELHLAGHGNQREELLLLSRENPRIKVLPWLSDDELAMEYAGAIGVIAPSRTHETFGLTIAEAAARSKCVIARNVGGLRESVERHQLGLLVDTDSDIVAAAAGLAKAPELAARLGTHGRWAYEREWTWERYRQRYFALIDELRGIRENSSHADKTVKE
jgi:glycosyltransferase involved in cell wall biosynthesis